MTNLVTAAVFSIFLTNWTTTSIERPAITPAIPPHGYVLVTNILHQTGAVQSNNVVEVPNGATTNRFTLTSTVLADVVPTKTTNQVVQVFSPSQF